MRAAVAGLKPQKAPQLHQHPLCAAPDLIRIPYCYKFTQTTASLGKTTHKTTWGQSEAEERTWRRLGRVTFGFELPAFLSSRCCLVSRFFRCMGGPFRAAARPDLFPFELTDACLLGWRNVSAHCERSPMVVS